MSNDSIRREAAARAGGLLPKALKIWQQTVLLVTLITAPAFSMAQHDAAIFRDADIALGEKLIAENRCAECHIRKFGGDGSSIYRPKGRINTAGFLRGMVEQCNTELKLQLFPEEVTAVAAVLNRDYYRFK